VMTSQEQGIKTLIPDLRNIPVDRLAELGLFLVAGRIIHVRQRIRNTPTRTTPEGGIQRVYWWRNRQKTGRGDHADLTSADEKAVLPHSGAPVEPAPDPGPRSSWVDLVAFVAVLAAGVLLVLFGHVATGGLTTACVALAWLYATFRGSRGRPRR
jgi:hypothetical protein